MEKVVERFECTVSKHDWRNGRQTFNLHIEGSGISQEKFEEMLKRIIGEIPELKKREF